MSMIDPGITGGYTAPPNDPNRQRRGDPFASGAVGGGSAPGTGTADQNDAYATLQSLLNQYGLGTLAQWAWGELMNNRSPNEIILALYDRPEFKARFPAIDARRQAGLPALSVSEYLAYEQQATQLMRAAGFPPSFFDQPQDFTNLLTKDVSLSELSSRIQVYQDAAYGQPAEVRQYLKDTYGVDEGHLAAYFADPDRALPLLQQQYRAAQIGGEASIQKFGPLSQSEAERLAALGVTEQQAAQGFGTVAQAEQLFQALPGEGGSTPGREEALGLVSGDAAAQQAVDVQARRRRATFGAGGGYAAGQQGLTGLGSAATT